MAFIIQGSDTGFNPLSFDELFAPVREYMSVYDQVSADYTDLVKQTETWRDIANREKSPEAYEMFRTYSDQLNAMARNFSENGLNSTNRRGVMGLKGGHSKYIEPISKASEAMKEANKLRDDAGPDAIFEVSRYDSLDSFLHGKTANNKRESRSEITQRTQQAIQAAVQSMLDRPEIRQSLSPQFLEVITGQRGNDMNALMRAIQNDPTASNIFTQIKGQMMNEIGMDRFDAEGMRRVEGAINQGLYAGLDNIQVALQNDGEYRNAAERDRSALSWASYNLEKDKWEEAKKQSHRTPLVDPETGMPNGEYWDSSIKGGGAVVDSEGNIIRKNIDKKTGLGGTGSIMGQKLSDLGATSTTALMSAISTPFYFDAKGLTGNRGFDETPYYSYQGHDGEGYYHKFSMLTGKGRTAALNYVGRLIGIDNYADVYKKSTSTYKEAADKILEQYVQVFRDQDWVSDNHFAVFLNGVDYKGSGSIGDEANLRAAYTGLLELKKGLAQVENKTSEQTTSTPSTQKTTATQFTPTGMGQSPYLYYTPDSTYLETIAK